MEPQRPSGLCLPVCATCPAQLFHMDTGGGVKWVPMLVQCALYQLDCPVPGLLFLTLKKPHFVYIVVVAGYAGHCMHGGQRTAHRSQFFLPQCGIWGSESGYHSWQQAPLPTEPPHLPVFVLKSSLIVYKLQPRLVSVCQPSASVGIRGMYYVLWFWPCIFSHAGSSQTLSSGSLLGRLPVNSRFLMFYKFL